MERVMSYCGGPSLLLYEGKLLIIASATLLVLIDTEGTAGSADTSNPGLWRVFKSFANAWGSAQEDGIDGTLGSKVPRVIGCEQAFLKGHGATIGLLEVTYED